jgi:purine-binding chemotaxis protein CheW
LEIIKKQEKSLGELLTQAGYITQEQLKDALKEKAFSTEPLGKILVRKGYVEEKQIVEMLKGLLVVVFEVNRELFAIEVVYSKEILKYRKITPIPSMPDYIAGMLSIREDVIPVISLNKKIFGRDTELTEETRIIIIETNEQKVGLIVDKVTAVKNFDSARYEKIAKHSITINKRYITGIIKDDDNIVTLLKPDILIEKE